jgi:hypothetical protein
MDLLASGLTENEGSAVWTDKKARLLRCIAQKKTNEVKVSAVCGWCMFILIFLIHFLLSFVAYS